MHSKGRCKRIKEHLDKGGQGKENKDGEGTQNKNGERKKNARGTKKPRTNWQCIS